VGYATDDEGDQQPFRPRCDRELAPALHDRGIKLHLYYSLLDWTHPAYRNDCAGLRGVLSGQLRELLTHYGEIAGCSLTLLAAAGFDASDAHFARAQVGPGRHL